MNWPHHYRTQASFHRDTAKEYRKAFAMLSVSDPHLADFCLQRSAINEDYALENDRQAIEAENHFTQPKQDRNAMRV